MSYAFVRDVPADETMYREVRAALGDETPKGLVAHLVLRQEHGLRYIDVWDTEGDWRRFRDGSLKPAVARMMASHGITPPATPPPEQPIEVIDTWVG
jgi:hypothetical protein